ERRASAAVRSVTSRNFTRRWPRCARELSTVSARPSSRWRTAPLANRSGTSESTSTATSPLTPCARVIWPTTTVGSDISVEDLDGGVNALAEGRRLHDRADRARRPAAPADDLAHVVGAHPELEGGPAVVAQLGHLDGVGIVHQLLGEVLEQLSRDAEVRRTRFSASNFSQMPTLASSVWTAWLGCAPLCSHSSALPSSISISEGSSSGWYLPMFSMKRPSRGLR